MREFTSATKTVQTLLANTRYTIDYYQREYSWEDKQVNELLDDLSNAFMEDYEDMHDRYQVAQYGRYFLGSMIICEKDGKRSIIDGQQRLTTLTLILMNLHQMLEDSDQKGQVANLIFSMSFGKKSFNLDVDERTAVMDSLYSTSEYDGNEDSESIRNIVGRFEYIRGNFPEELQNSTLPYFVDWLLGNVYLVEITASEDSDAYSIFETMNDRGLSLTPTDMLKGYLLSRITDSGQRDKGSQIWRNSIERLQALGKEEDADAIKAWLRSQYAVSMRERRRGARSRDFELIGTEFHRWVRDAESIIGLNSGSDFFRFIERDFDFYTGWYCELRESSKNFRPELECVYYNAQNNFTLQYPVLMAPLRLDDSHDTCMKKIRVVARYIDILINRRIWNYRDIGYGTMFYAMYLLIKDIRGENIDNLTNILFRKLQEEDTTFIDSDNFQLRGRNRQRIHRTLARITHYIETGSKEASMSHYLEYFRTGRNRFEIEHIWADHPDRHEDEFSHPNEFTEYRNRIGGLLLLPKSNNASYSDAIYTKKRENYATQNILARSLHEKAYDHNPAFTQFINESGLPFRPHKEFKMSDLDEREKLYQQIAEQIWNPERIMADSGIE